MIQVVVEEDLAQPPNPPQHLEAEAAVAVVVAAAVAVVAAAEAVVDLLLSRPPLKEV